MKPIFFLLTSICILTTVTGCKKNNIIGIIGKGDSVTETREINDFDRISLSTDADVDYTQDSVYYVEVTGQKNILEVLDLKKEGSKLVIDFRKNVWKHNKLKIVIHSPNMKALAISGSGDIRVQNNLQSTDLDLRISGSGNIHLPSLNSSHLDASISGSGDISITGGTTVSQKLSISGSGNMDVLNLNASDCSCKISGSGDMDVRAGETLDVSISGSGDIKYIGRPRINSNISGSGTLKGI